MKRVRSRVGAFVEGPDNAEREVILGVVRETFPLQDEFDDSGARRLREKVRTLRVESRKRQSFTHSTKSDDKSYEFSPIL